MAPIASNLQTALEYRLPGCTSHPQDDGFGSGDRSTYQKASAGGVRINPQAIGCSCLLYSERGIFIPKEFGAGHTVIRRRIVGVGVNHRLTRISVQCIGVGILQQHRWIDSVIGVQLKPRGRCNGAEIYFTAILSKTAGEGIFRAKIIDQGSRSRNRIKGIELPARDTILCVKKDFTIIPADSFRAVFMQWSDMVSAGPCPTDEFKEYAKGSYQLNYNTISLNGFFTDSSFNGIASGCYRTGPFHQEFKIHLECESLRLNPVGNQSPTYTIRMHR